MFSGVATDVQSPGFPMAAFAEAIAAEHSAALVISRPAAHVSPGNMRVCQGVAELPPPHAQHIVFEEKSVSS